MNKLSEKKYAHLKLVALMASASAIAIVGSASAQDAKTKEQSDIL